ncbi:MAG: sn-glycerol-3-phosphate ABC transporter ATP-binding protein UgpC [Eubacteriales bacterium]|nr:sn-glycerol-3-phosphate ABC transporter ATP-binding protein UgpC [Eubacteriales bacterium]
MASIELKNICKKYENGFEAVKDFNLKIKDNEFIIFVGPSGCGKSTTLRMIAGLEEISEGELWIDGKKMNGVSASDRDIAMVFQNYALYPHMSVRKNIAYSLKIRKEKKDVIEKKVQEAASILGLEGVLDRKPGQLSGGQKQRVAMGRAIVRNPKVFLMDEPLSNLDAKLRGQMRVEIADLYHKLGTTFIYVTHDQTEAMTLGTRIVVMKDGVIQQVDSPQNLYHKPANQFVAGFIGTPPMNFIEGVVNFAPGGVFVETEDGKVEMPPEKAECLKRRNLSGKRVVLGIRPEHIDIAGENEMSHKKAVIDVYEMLGAEAMIYLSQKGSKEKLIARIDGTMPLCAGETVNLRYNLSKIHVFDITTGKTITN